jgi:hypothetical protein
MQLACDVIDNCRCYARTASGPQFCGARHGPNVDPCPPACCAGGCDGPEPFAILDEGASNTSGSFWFRFVILVILVLLSTATLA